MKKQKLSGSSAKLVWDTAASLCACSKSILEVTSRIACKRLGTRGRDSAAPKGEPKISQIELVVVEFVQPDSLSALNDILPTTRATQNEQR